MNIHDDSWGQSNRCNVGDLERIASVIGGAGFLFDALLSSSWRRLPSTLLGSYLLYRGVTGRCPAYQRLYDRLQGKTSGERRLLQAPTRPVELLPEPDEDRVTQASDQSFPASDPPAW